MFNKRTLFVSKQPPPPNVYVNVLLFIFDESLLTGPFERLSVESLYEVVS